LTNDSGILLVPNYGVYLPYYLIVLTQEAPLAGSRPEEIGKECMTFGILKKRCSHKDDSRMDLGCLVPGKKLVELYTI
jgi:hypothetical protein